MRLDDPFKWNPHADLGLYAPNEMHVVIASIAARFASTGTL